MSEYKFYPEIDLTDEQADIIEEQILEDLNKSGERVYTREDISWFTGKLEINVKIINTMLDV